MKNNMKKLAAALLSGTMLLGMTGSVFAADAQTDAMSVSVTANDTSAVLTKTWTAAENGLLKDGEEFTFQLTYDSVEAVSTNVPAAPQYMNQLMSEGTAVDTTLSAQWKTSAAGGNTSSATKSYVDLLNGISFTTPGTYHFTLSENAGINPNISYDTATYEIIVQVVWKDNFEGLKINGVSTAQGENKLDGATFENNAAANKTLTVSKKVGGGAANKNDDFTFKVTITGIDGTYSTNVAGKTITNGTETEFTLRHAHTGNSRGNVGKPPRDRGGGGLHRLRHPGGAGLGAAEAMPGLPGGRRRSGRGLRYPRLDEGTVPALRSGRGVHREFYPGGAVLSEGKEETGCSADGAKPCGQPLQGAGRHHERSCIRGRPEGRQARRFLRGNGGN